MARKHKSPDRVAHTTSAANDHHPRASGHRKEHENPLESGSGAPDAVALEDEEIADAIREQFFDEVGADLAGVEVRCHRGCVTLTGEVASEELREVARLIVEDENGLQVRDRMLVSQIAGELPGETENTGHRLPDDVGLTHDDLDTDDVTSDILEIEDEGIGYQAPSRPVPER